jgi:hypothetical protein
MSFIKNNWFKLITIIVLILILIVYYDNSTTNSSYRINTKCAEDTRSYAKIKDADDYVSWRVIESKFINSESACYGEFEILGPSKSDYFIYDLTHNKEIYLFHLLSTDANIYGEEYRKERARIFGEN